MKTEVSNPDIMFPLLASNSFDISLFESFFPLLSGGKTLMLDNDHIKDVSYLAEQLKNVTAFHAVPALMSQLVKHIEEKNEKDQYSKIKNLFIGGDAVSTSVLKEMNNIFPTAHIHTLYGPTESTIFITSNQYLAGKDNLFRGAIIGKPNPGIQIYILDTQQQLVPVGVIGEIYTGGTGVSRGYLNQKELTEEKFVESPFKEGVRLYKTGDLGRWLTDGNIEFVGRKDAQVKIRGYRIELGEIEQVLLSNEQIKEAVVLVIENQSNEKELVGYITAKEEQNASDLRSYLKAFLPEYMLPSYFVQLEVMPLTSNGKIDKRSLPDPQGLGLSSGVEYIAPRNEIEEKLVKIWQEILEKQKIGVKDNFFEIGGNSIKATKVISRVNREFKTAIKIGNLFKTSTVEDLSNIIDFAISQRNISLKEDLKEIEL